MALRKRDYLKPTLERRASVDSPMSHQDDMSNNAQVVSDAAALPGEVKLVEGAAVHSHSIVGTHGKDGTLGTGNGTAHSHSYGRLCTKTTPDICPVRPTSLMDVKRLMVLIIPILVCAGVLAGLCLYRAKRGNRKLKDAEASTSPTAATSDMKSRYWRLAVAYVAYVLMNAHYGFLLVFSAYRQGLKEQYVLSDSIVSSCFTSMNTGALFFAFLPGALFDKYGCEWTCVFAATCAAGGLLLCNLNIATWWYPLCYFFFGLGSRGFSTAGVIGCVSVFPETHAATAAAGLMLFNSFAITLNCLVYDRLLKSNFSAFQVYMTIYSVLAAAYGILASRLVRNDPPEPRPELEEEETKEEEDEQEEDTLDVMMTAATDVFKHSSMVARLSKKESEEQRTSKFRHVLISVPFVFLSLVHCVETAFSFAFLGHAGDAAVSMGMDQSKVGSFVASLGLWGALGRFCLGMTTDTMQRCSKAFGKYFFFMIAYSLYTVSLWIMVFRPEYFSVCAGICISCFGGTLSLAPGTIRLEFGGAQVGRIYGVLFTMMSFTFTVWDFGSPSGSHTSFRPWFTVAASMMSIVWLASVLMYIRSFGRP